MKTPTTALLVVIAVLLAANLFVSLPPQEAQAQAQPPPFPPPVDDTPTVIGVSAIVIGTGLGDVSFIYRIWSDGMVEENRFVFNTNNCPGAAEGHLAGWCGWTTVPE